MERGEMEDICVGDGMNRFSFHAFVSWSPVIVQLGHSVYGLLGAEVPEAEDRGAGQGPPRQPHGPPRAGRPRLDRGRQGLAQLPALEGGQHLRGDHRARRAEEGGPRPIRARRRRTARQIGTLATKDGRAWGLGGVPAASRRADRRQHRRSRSTSTSGPPPSAGRPGRRRLRTGESISVARMYPAHSVCRCRRHTECAGYIENTTVIDSAILRPRT